MIDLGSTTVVAAASGPTRSTAPSLLRDAGRLRRRREELLAVKRMRRLELEEIEALAECSFRLAVHPDTPLREGAELLRGAVRIDGTNPKYAYHLARVHFLLGNLDLAVTWLQQAVMLCPTSHRIWSHVSMLQRELNTRYKGNDRYEPDALRQRGEQIATAVQNGRDELEADWLDFVPPLSLAQKEKEARTQSGTPGMPPAENGDEQPAKGLPPGVALRKVRRLARPNQCRWNGIHDLIAEALLEARPTNRVLENLLPLLQQSAEAMAHRRGGLAGFVTLCVQWLLAGYPAATIRRLADQLPSECTGPSRELLTLVLELYEADRAELPEMLARALASGKLPPLLAAAIHSRRLLIRPLTFRSLGTYRAARKLLARASHSPPDENDPVAARKFADEVAELVSRLVRAVETLYPKPPQPLKDKIPQMAGAAAPRDTAALCKDFEILERASAQLETLCKEQAWKFLKDNLELPVNRASDAAEFSQVAADREKFAEVLNLLQQSAESGNQALRDVLAAIGRDEKAVLPDNFQARQDECGKHFVEVITRLRKFNQVLGRVDRNLAAGRERFEVHAAEPSAAVVALAEQVRSVAAEAMRLGAEPADAAAPAEGDRVADLLRRAEELTASLQQHWARLKELAAAQKQQALGAAELNEAADIAAAVECAWTTCEQGLVEVAEIRKAGQVPPEALPRLDAAEKEFQGMGMRRGPFARTLRQLPIPERAAAAPVEPAAAEEKKAQTPYPTPPPFNPPENLHGLPLLRRAVAYTQRELTKLFDEALATFRFYPAWARLLPPLKALQSTIRARQAETWYRLGQRDEARRVWRAMFREDPLDYRVLRNLAVCDTADAEPGRSLASWQAYLEMLYFYDVVSGVPRLHADTRRQFHRAFSHSYAPRLLLEKLDNDWLEKITPDAVVSFLTNPGRIANFVEHKLLEFLNAQLQFTSPPLVLGASRAAGEEARQRARDRQLAFHREVQELLPRRVRAGFRHLADEHVAEAYERCSSARRLTQKKDPHYPQEKDRLLNMLADFCELKFKLYLMLHRAGDSVKHVTSAEGLRQLLRLDLVPIDASDEFLAAVAGKLHRRPDELIELMQHVVKAMVLDLIKEALRESADAEENDRRARQYRMLAGDLLKLPALEELVPILDSPHRIPAIREDVLDDMSPEALRPTLERWHARYPEMGGVARDLGIQHWNDGRTEQALSVLRSGMDKGMHVASRDDCARALADMLSKLNRTDEAREVLERLKASKPEEQRAELDRMSKQLAFRRAMEDEQYDQAIELGVALADQDDRTPALVQNVIVAFVEAGRVSNTDPGHARLMECVSGWIQRAEDRRLQQETEPDGEEEPAAAVDEATLERIATLRDQAVVQLVVAAHRRDQDLDASALVKALNALLQAYPHLAEAYYYRMLAWHQRAVAASQAKRKDEFKGCLTEALADAQRVLDHSQDEAQRRQATELREQLGKLQEI